MHRQAKLYRCPTNECKNVFDADNSPADVKKQQGKIHSFCELLPNVFLYSHKCWTVILSNRNIKTKNRQQKTKTNNGPDLV